MTQYALRDRSVTFSGRTNLFVDGKELGSVPRLAIADDKDGEYLLLHCSQTWNVRGVAGYDSLRDAKRAAERVYPGIAKKWLRTGTSKAQAEVYRMWIWKGLECSLCGRRPDQFERMVAKRRLRICDICVRELSAIVTTDQPSSSA